MNHQRSRCLTAAAALIGWTGFGGALAHPEGSGAAAMEQLEGQNAALRESLVASNQREKESAEALAKIRLSLEALGKNIRIEFRFNSDELENFAGWYIDDVVVTVP